MGYGSPLYNALGTTDRQQIADAQAKLRSGELQPITYKSGSNKTGVTIGFQNVKTGQTNISTSNLNEQNLLDYRKAESDWYKTSTAQFKEAGATPVYDRGNIIGYTTPTQSVMFSKAEQIAVNKGQPVNLSIIPSPTPQLGSMSTLRRTEPYMSVWNKPQGQEQGNILDTKVSQPGFLSQLGQKYGEFMMPPATTYSSQPFTAKEQKNLNLDITFRRLSYGETARTSEAFSKLYPDVFKYSYTVPAPIRWGSIAATAIPEAQVIGLGITGGLQLLKIPAIYGGIGLGSLAASSIPTMFTGFKQDWVATSARLTGNIYGGFNAPNPNLKPITFQWTRFKEITNVNMEGNTLSASGRMAIKRIEGLSYSEYTVPFKTTGRVKTFPEIGTKTPFIMKYQQAGTAFKIGIDMFKQTPKGILFDTRFNPITSFKIPNGFLSGTLGTATITRNVKSGGGRMFSFGEISTTLKGSSAKGGGIMYYTTPTGVKNQPFISKTRGMELISTDKGTFVLGESKVFKANKIVFDIAPRSIKIITGRTSKIPLVAKGVTFIPGETSNIFSSGKQSIFTTTQLKGLFGNLNPPLIIKSQPITALKSPIVLMGKKTMQIQEIKVAQAFKFKEITMPKQRVEPKTIQISKPIQISKTIQMPRTITEFKLGLIQTPIEIQLPRQVQMPRQTTMPGIGIPTSPILNIPPFVPGGVPFIFPPFGWGSDSGSLAKRKIRGKQPKRYTPSFAAIVLGIRGKQPKGIETGLRLRPITKGFSFMGKKMKGGLI